ncbi:unnamed protein product [Macrosiphum euphorbiae]|uniref:Uncharacterized protein n=1 Tax=Macrosiphum euphorbiae TaxID=13131 RepID=A0AAV0XET8_9HEMI|nr:unnamed protein product [Macrosiphum euphorbiae]
MTSSRPQANETDAFIMDRWLGVVNEPPCPQYEFGDIEVMAKSVCTHQTILVLETPMVMARAMSHQNGCRVMSVGGRSSRGRLRIGVDGQGVAVHATDKRDVSIRNA